MHRRYFLRTMAGVAGWFVSTRPVYPRDKLKGVVKFSATLPGLGPEHANNFGNYIPVLSPDTMTFPGTDYYHIVAQQFTQTLYPAIGPSRFWGYSDAKKPHNQYLGGFIVARQGRPVRLRVTNSLPPQHLLPVDPTAIDQPMIDAVGGRVDRITVHLHGGIVPWSSDGGPCSWFTNPANPGGFIHGASFVNRAGDGGSAIYDYPNKQSARLVWYHDHAYGITRLNAYAGLASAYIITDDAEAQMIKDGL